MGHRSRPITDEIGLDGVFALFEPLLGRMIRRQYQSNLGRLKTILEAEHATS